MRDLVAAFRAILSGGLSTGSLLLPWFAPYWAPGLIFGTLVAAPAASRRDSGVFGMSLAAIGSLLGWALAVIAYLGSQSPARVPLIVWLFAMGAAGAAVVTLFVWGVLSLEAWKRIVLACFIGGTLSMLIGWGWKMFPASGPRWIAQMALSMGLWQWAIQFVLLERSVGQQDSLTGEGQ